MPGMPVTSNSTPVSVTPLTATPDDFDPSSLKRDLDFARHLSTLAADAILPHFRSTDQIDNKHADAATGGFDPVTEADRAAERAMREAIEARFPEDGISGEEYSARPARNNRRWVLDPIDGTRSFILGIPLWGTLIGLEIDDRPVVGMMNQPFTGELYQGTPGRAALIRGGEHQPLKTSARTALADAYLGSTAPDLFKAKAQRTAFKHIAERCRLTRFGGDCYYYCQLAAGRIDLVIEPGLSPHDIIPLIPIIEGAGGIVTDWSGGAAREGGDIIAAANAGLHASALEVLNA